VRLQARRTANVYRKLDSRWTAALVRACRRRGATVSAALCAAAAFGASDAMGDDRGAAHKGEKGEKGETGGEDGGPATQRYKVHHVCVCV
jgi:hypothetical protein